MDFKKLTDDLLVTDIEKTGHGVGKVEKIEEESVDVYFDEIHETVRYSKEEVKFLEEL
jgi:hypothetical protein